MAGFGVGIAAAEDSTGDNSAGDSSSSDSSNDNSASDSSTSDSASDSSGDSSVSDNSVDDSNSDSSGDSSVDDSTDDSDDDTPEDNSVSYDSTNDDSASDDSTSDDSDDYYTNDESTDADTYIESDDSTVFRPGVHDDSTLTDEDRQVYPGSSPDGPPYVIINTSSDNDYNISSDDDETYTYTNNTSKYSDDDITIANNNSTVIKDYSTTKIDETTTVTIDKSKNVNYKVVNDNSVVNNIYFTPTKSSGTAKIVVEDLKDDKCLKVKPAGNIYQSFNIWIDNKDVANNMENAAVDFKVEKSWLTANGLDKSAIVLNMYDNGKWIEVPITITSEDSKYIYFKAEVSRYSTFAITSKTVVVDTSLEQSNTKISEEPIDEPTKNVIVKLLELIIDLLE